MAARPEKTLYIVDGHALAFRAYYAMIRNPLTTSTGTPVSAVFGFAGYLLRLMRDPKCSHLVVTFDSGRATFRTEMYAEYKANRSEMPDEMKIQMPLLKKLVEVLRLPVFSKEGFEADDIIAYLARKAESEGYGVRLVTKDKDLMQLISPAVRMLAPETGGTFTDMGPEEVLEKMGVVPGKIRDLLALMGDASDNIPGVPGIGPKTAITILEKCGDIEQLLADPASAGNPKHAAKIADNLDALAISLKLVTLNPEVGLDVPMEDLIRREPDAKACAAFFNELEFHSLAADPLFDVRETTAYAVTVPATLDEVRDIAAQIQQAGFVSVDTETTSLNPHEAIIVGISLAISTTSAWYIPTGHNEGPNLPICEVLDILRPVLASADIRKIGQNLKYDIQVFRNSGLELAGISFDSMLAAYVADPSRRAYNLGDLASEWLKLKTIPIAELIGSGAKQVSFATVSVADAATYSGEDAVLPLLLQEKIAPVLSAADQDRLCDTIEIPLIAVLADMEWAGILVDTAVLSAMAEEFSGRLAAITAEIYTMAGREFNLNSPKQIGEVFYGELGLPGGKKTKTGFSTDVDALERLAPQYPIAAKLLEHREVQKLLSTYILALPQAIDPSTGRVHTSFNQTVTATGRLSSTDPNLQNIPIRTEAGRRIRMAFVAPEGMRIISADYSQIELRLLAHFSQDDRLIEAFVEDRDIHTQTASTMYGIFPEMVTPDMRRAAKVINFGLMYGMGAMRLSGELGISFKEAQHFIELYFAQFPTIQRYMDTSIVTARDKGYCETLFGRRRPVPDISSSAVRVREAAERIAVNTPVQGTAADIIKIAMIDIHTHIGAKFPGARMLLQVHDELVFEVPEAVAEACAAWVQERMSAAASLSVPLKVEVGIARNWAEAH